MAIPSRILLIDGDSATVECFGVERVVSLMLMPEPVAIGDYVLIQSGAFAVETVEAEAALAALDYLRQVLAEPDTANDAA